MLRGKFFKALKKVSGAGFKDAEAILFRCTKQEIFDLAASGDVKALIKEKSDSELRWRVMSYRFLNKILGK